MKNKIITIEKKGVKNLKKLLMKVYCVSKEQAIYILNFFGDDNPEQTLNYLVKTRVLFEIGSNGIGVSPNVEYNYNNIMSIWILIKFLNKIDLNNVYLTQEPSSVFFLMDNEMYEVVIVDKGRESQIAHAVQYRAKTNPNVSYITVLGEASQLDEFYDEISIYEHVNTIFALAMGYDESGSLVISIMQKE